MEEKERTVPGHTDSLKRARMEWLPPRFHGVLLGPFCSCRHIQKSTRSDGPFPIPPTPTNAANLAGPFHNFEVVE